MVVPRDRPQPLRDLLQPGGRFEWIVGRQPALPTDGVDTQEWVAALSALAVPGAHLRLLFSQPRIGPATGLLSLLRSSGGANSTIPPLLERAGAIEAEGLEQEALFPPAWLSELERQGWQLQKQEWEESLELQLVERLLERWFGPLVAYRASLVAAGWTSQELETLRSLFAAHLGARLPQLLRHGVLEGRWTEAMSQQKSPGRGRGKKG
jgi:putative ATPase